MSSTTLFAIRQRSTGYFMPEEGAFTRTQTEPRSYCVPRLFTSAGAAKCALTWWLRGEHHMSWHRDPEWGHKEIDGLECEERPERKTEDMEVIPMELSYE